MKLKRRYQQGGGLIYTPFIPEQQSTASTTSRTKSSDSDEDAKKIFRKYGVSEKPKVDKTGRAVIESRELKGSGNIYDFDYDYSSFNNLHSMDWVRIETDDGELYGNYKLKADLSNFNFKDIGQALRQLLSQKYGYNISFKKVLSDEEVEKSFISFEAVESMNYHRNRKLRESKDETITWDDLRRTEFVYSIDGFGDDWKYIRFFESSDDIYEDDLPEGEDPDDYSTVYYEIYNADKEEVDGGGLIAPLSETFNANDLIGRLLELSGGIDVFGDKTFTRLDSDFLDESLKESRQLNEGPGAGYTIRGKVGDVEINSLTIKDTQEDGNYIYYTIDCDIDLDLDDVECESAYYGGTISETPVKVEYMKLSAGKDWDLPAPTDDSVFDLLMGLKIDTVYGGGWSHSTFELKVKFTDPGAVDAIDKYATGDNYNVEYAVVDDSGNKIEYFVDNELDDAIEYAKENNCVKVVETRWYWEYLGNDEYDDIDSYDEDVWKNEDLEGEQ